MAISSSRGARAGAVVFRWSYRHHITGKVVRPKNGRPFPIPMRKRRKVDAARQLPLPFFPPKAPHPPRAPAKVRRAVKRKARPSGAP